MQNFMKTIINALKYWTQSKIENSSAKLNTRIDNSKADWHENNPDADSYVKNRPFYKATELIELINTQISYDPYEEFYLAGFGQDNMPVVGNVYSISINNDTPQIITLDKDMKYTYIHSKTGKIYNMDFNVSWLSGVCFTAEDGSTEQVHLFVGIIDEVYHKLDQKYLPDEVGVQSDWNEEDENSKAYIHNKPIFPEWSMQDAKPSYTVDEIEGAARQSDLNEMKNGIVLLDTISGIPYIIQMQNGNLVSSINASIDDFAYTVNDDGMYAITGWNQTYLGESSTEMILPEDSKIIV